MCIVSYIPHLNGCSLTSNRDEQINRPALEPALYSIGNTKLIYPKDLKSGGTWFAVDPKKKKICCLLNAKSGTNKVLPRTSRGRLPIKLLLDSKLKFRKKDLADTAPFFLIQLNFQYQKAKIISTAWNGLEIKECFPNPKKPYLWCSTSLYDSQSNNAFQKQFREALPDLNSPEKILSFHQRMAQPLNNDQFLLKNKYLQTVSITSLTENGEKCNLTYLNLIEKNKKVTTLPLYC